MSLREIGCSDRGTIRGSTSFASLTGTIIWKRRETARPKPRFRGSSHQSAIVRKKRGPGRAEGLVPAPAPEGEDFCPSEPVVRAHQVGQLGAASLVVVMHGSVRLWFPIDSSIPLDSTIRARKAGRGQADCFQRFAPDSRR